jgi:hypothetical protein
MWACEVAANMPNGYVDAVDISNEQFPPPQFQPRNTRFWTHDFFRPFAPQHLSQFNAVNLKFVLYLVNDEVADELITNVLTLLSKSIGFSQTARASKDLKHAADR